MKSLKKGKRDILYNKRRNTRSFKELNVGNRVYFKKNPLSVWLPGTVVEVCKEPRSYCVKDGEGVAYRRNRQHILQVPQEASRSTVQECNNKTDNLNLTKDVEDVTENTNNYHSRSGRKIIAPQRLGIDN